MSKTTWTKTSKAKRNTRNKSKISAKQIDNFRSPFKYVSYFFDNKNKGKPIYAIKFNPYIRDRNIFATVAGDRIYVLECLDHDDSTTRTLDSGELETSFEEKQQSEKPNLIKNLLAYKGGSDSYYALAWSYDEKKRPLLTVGGEDGIVRVIVITGSDKDELKSLTGHTGFINDMKFQPTNHIILLSASADHTVRMWNMKELVCIAVFAGPAHISQTISIDFQPEGKYFVAGGMDYVISIWNLESIQSTKVENTIERTIRVYDHEFKAQGLHPNYVDSVIWLDVNSFISRSCNGEIYWWKTGSVAEPELKLESKEIFKLVQVAQETSNPEEIQWFVRMEVSNQRRYLAIGSTNGDILLYDLQSKSADGLKRATVTHPKAKSLIRMISFSNDDSIMIACTSDGRIIRYDLDVMLVNQPIS